MNAKLQAVARSIQYFLASEDGPTAVEYAFLLSLILIACIGSVQIVGANVNTMLSNAATKLGS